MNLCFQRFRRMSDFVAVVGHFIQGTKHDCIGGTAQHLHGRRRHAQHAHDTNALQFFVAENGNRVFVNTVLENNHF